MAVFPNLLERGALAEAGNVRVLAGVFLAAPGVVDIGDAGDIVAVQLTVGAVHHPTQLAGVDEQDLAPPLAVSAASAVPGQEPEADGYLRGVEELTGQGHHAVHQVGLDKVLSDLALARLVRRHGAVG